MSGGVAVAVHNRIMATRPRRSPARLWWEFGMNVRFLSDWLALHLLPWWWVVGFHDVCADLRRGHPR